MLVVEDAFKVGFYVGCCLALSLVDDTEEGIVICPNVAVNVLFENDISGCMRLHKYLVQAGLVPARV